MTAAERTRRAMIEEQARLAKDWFAGAYMTTPDRLGRASMFCDHCGHACSTLPIECPHSFCELCDPIDTIRAFGKLATFLETGKIPRMHGFLVGIPRTEVIL